MRNKRKQHMRAIVAILLVLGTGLITAPARADTDKPVLIELFTTQSCSSCPPADKMVQKLAAEDPDILVLGCHVNYFDSYGWEDTLSKEFCQWRHFGYKQSIGFNRIATPTLVINGAHEIIGANEQLTRSGIRMVRSLEPTGEIILSRTGDYLDITLPAMALGTKADVWLFAYDPITTVKIGAGENGGRTIDYINPVKYMTKLMMWDGKSMNMAFPIAGMQAKNYAVVAQVASKKGVIAMGRLN